MVFFFHFVILIEKWKRYLWNRQRMQKKPQAKMRYVKVVPPIVNARCVVKR